MCDAKLETPTQTPALKLSDWLLELLALLLLLLLLLQLQLLHAYGAVVVITLLVLPLSLSIYMLMLLSFACFLLLLYYRIIWQIGFAELFFYLLFKSNSQ